MLTSAARNKYLSDTKAGALCILIAKGLEIIMQLELILYWHKGVIFTIESHIGKSSLSWLDSSVAL